MKMVKSITILFRKGMMDVSEPKTPNIKAISDYLLRKSNLESEVEEQFNKEKEIINHKRSIIFMLCYTLFFLLLVCQEMPEYLFKILTGSSLLFLMWFIISVTNKLEQTIRMKILYEKNYEEVSRLNCSLEKKIKEIE